jgi:hypothetical protein
MAVAHVQRRRDVLAGKPPALAQAAAGAVDGYGAPGSSRGFHMNWTDAFIFVVVAGNIAGGLFSWRSAIRLRRELQTAEAYRILLTRLAVRQFGNAAWSSHTWRMWAGTMGTIRITVTQDDGEDEA